MTGDEVPNEIRGSRQDPYYGIAREVVMRERRPSISMVQRHLQIRYGHAARLLEAMEGDVVTAMNAAGSRSMLTGRD
jgi:DNA segregation ATPase FtsK/SpoIIIE-like protein